MVCRSLASSVLIYVNGLLRLVLLKWSMLCWLFKKILALYVLVLSFSLFFR
ncbi:hypothetical protein HanIR_Chr14g0717851 [Helianthus annuus]|nr:hypothetical protein HanIR_Chr14g0717851 [Helianthus annuus]